MPNRLAAETSPYLLQHANNPVDWYPWGPEALERAQAEGKPILLSIGYSACHWCHVMERESFENEAIAARMNANFVCIKVDREERPDLDEIYMKAVQAFQSGRGGWPMTVFLSPEGEPFFGGTYYPPESRDGMPGFDSILARMHTMWTTQRGQVDDLRGRVRTMLADVSTLPEAATHIDTRWLEPVVAAVLSQFDATDGGLKGAPKFPPHGALAALLAHGVQVGHEPSLDAALLTLDRIGQGGMYDLLGGGFARYSVDTEWRVPHFEKMLYDNAQLLGVYVEAWRMTGAPRFEAIVRRTVRWVLEEMRLPSGGFAASQDADSEGVEGKFFAWTPLQLAEVLDASDAERFAAVAGVTVEGTFEHGASVLRLERPTHQLDRRERALVERCIPRLFRVRRKRVAPERDDKVVTAWNGLMIRALAQAGALLEEPEWIEAAAACARFLLDEVTVDGRLMRTHKDGKAHIPAYADDHAALMLGLVDLYQATFDRRWLDESVGLADRLEALFVAEGGGLYTTGSDQPELVVRAMQGLAGAEPSANGLAALALARLALLLDRDDLGARADRILARLQTYLAEAPGALGLEAVAGAFRAARPTTIAIVGDDAAPLLRAARRHAPPFHALAAGSGGAAIGLPWTDGKEADVPTAFVCEGHTCQLPVTAPRALVEQLDTLARAPRSRPAPVALRIDGPLLPSHASRWLQTSTPPSSEDLRGQVVVLHLFAASGADAWSSIQEVSALDATYRDRSVVVLGVASPRYPGESERRAVARMVGRHRIDHPVLVDEDNELFDALGVKQRPSVIVLDPQGRIAWRHDGPVRSQALVAQVVDALLADGGLSEPLPPPEVTHVPGQPLAFPSRVHTWPDAMMQELGADALSGGTLYVSDSGHHRILELFIRQGSDGWPELELARTFGGMEPGHVDGAEAPRFHLPQGICRSGDRLYVADTGNHALRCIELSTGAVSTLAGTGRPGLRSPRGPLDWSNPLEVDLYAPVDVEVLDAKGEDLVFIAMAGTNQVWAYGNGSLGLFAGSGRLGHVDGPSPEASLGQPSGLALFGRYLLFTDAATHSIRGLDLQHHQAVTVTGAGVDDHGDRDGVGEAARMQYPLDLTFMGETVFVADTLNSKIRSVSLATIEVKTVAGGDLDVLAHPSGIDRIGGFLVIADSDNHRLRVLDPKTGELRDLTWGSP